MPIKVLDNLPAKQLLLNENIFVMDESIAFHQDIRPLKIAILNLMPNKLTTEVQLLRLLSNTPLQQDITLLHAGSHISKNTSSEYLLSYYKTFDNVKEEKFDGFIITGAPIEHLEFEDVTYWEELKNIMEWTKTNVTSTFHICWGAQAGLYYHYGINKYPLEKKMFGVFPHRLSSLNEKVNQDSQAVANYARLLRGFDSVFYVPHSRHTGLYKCDFEEIDNLSVLCESDESGIYIAASSDLRRIFITGHSEYDADTLQKEYERDLAKGISLDVPKNYFENDDPSKIPHVTWRAHANILFSNWLNIVYQETPFKID